MTTDLGTLHMVGERMMLRFERKLSHPIERVWRMPTDPDGLARWFPARTEYESFAVGDGHPIFGSPRGLVGA